jgi:simple sugar transport system permease protein
VRIPVLAEIPVIGPAFFAHDVLVYAAVPLAVATWWVLRTTRWGLAVCAGVERVAAGQVFPMTDLGKMNWLVEGVVGQAR